MYLNGETATENVEREPGPAHFVNHFGQLNGIQIVAGERRQIFLLQLARLRMIARDGEHVVNVRRMHFFQLCQKRHREDC